MKIRFMSGNAHKITEVQRILAPVGVDIVPVSKKIEELQTEDVESLVRDKLTKAFEAIGRPLFVEHTGLYLSGLNGLPAGLTQIFWDRLQADRFADLVAGLGDAKVTAKTILGYCDGREIHTFVGAIDGTVPRKPAGPTHFQWDCVFVPDGSTQTFAEMGAAKDDISMRRKALDLFAAHLKSAKGTK
ncbi:MULTISPECIES: non-canonical purine NTP pyrophosphatase [Burkholderia]|nr:MULTISPECIES: non-canonical purine NTP pyrophosphatase [Burkholderia]ELW9527544.1 non-canonical purine NTP pyrophosphatase [Burkholderia cenocepacia]KWN76988.1 non-canonical purine NTP pyrophosphatase [Burkholderia stagnalis]MBJ9591046.1 non-canonical purine NTP pyrophosphatase [Burkholderia seminalis]ALB10768.1 nucleoside-triphosphatase [Burkholderia pseudomallei]MBF3439202.1 non-canonical purine NTP pyrophosphatase [Burkholderia pseudomallei]